MMSDLVVPNAFNEEETYIRRTRLSSSQVAAVLEFFCADVPASVAARKLGVSRKTTESVYGKMRIRIMDLSSGEAARFAQDVPMNEELLSIERPSWGGLFLELHKRRFRVFVRVTGTQTASAYSGTSSERIKAALLYSIPLSDAYRLLVSKDKVRLLVFGKSSAIDRDYQRVEANRRRREEAWQLEWLGKINHGFSLPPKTMIEEILLKVKTTRIALTCVNRKLFPPGSNKRKDIMTFLNFTKARIMTMRGVGENHFLLHLKESEWRFNHRSDDIAELIRKELLMRPL